MKATTSFLTVPDDDITIELTRNENDLVRHAAAQAAPPCLTPASRSPALFW
jgi:hypothetical protein